MANSNLIVALVVGRVDVIYLMRNTRLPNSLTLPR